MMKQKSIELKLRPAATDDIEFIFQLRVKTMKPFFKDTIGWNDTAEREKAADELTHARIVGVDNQDIGVIKAVPRRNELHLHQMQILPEFQRKGFGTELIRQIIMRSESLQIPITLFVIKNTPAKHLYDQFGFTTTEDSEYHCKMRRHPKKNRHR